MVVPKFTSLPYCTLRAEGMMLHCLRNLVNGLDNKGGLAPPALFTDLPGPLNPMELYVMSLTLMYVTCEPALVLLGQLLLPSRGKV